MKKVSYEKDKVKCKTSESAGKTIYDFGDIRFFFEGSFTSKKSLMSLKYIYSIYTQGVSANDSFKNAMVKIFRENSSIAKFGIAQIFMIKLLWQNYFCQYSLGRKR